MDGRPVPKGVLEFQTEGLGVGGKGQGFWSGRSFIETTEAIAGKREEQLHPAMVPVSFQVIHIGMEVAGFVEGNAVQVQRQEELALVIYPGNLEVQGVMASLHEVVDLHAQARMKAGGIQGVAALG